jgi:excisionase family DNA binding protein
MPDISEYMTVQEAAEELGYHPKSIYRLLNRGDLEAEKRGVWLILRKSVEDYAQSVRGLDKNDPRRGDLL